MVRVSVTELDFTQQSSSLADRLVDVAIVRPPLSDDGIVATPIAMEPRVAVIPDNHPLARSPRVMVSDVLSLPVPAVDPAVPRAWTNFCRMVDRRGGVPIREVGPADVRTQVELLHAVTLRDSMDTAGASIARSYPFPGVAYVPIVDIGACEIAVAARGGEPNALVEFFVSTARQVCRRSPTLMAPPS